MCSSSLHWRQDRMRAFRTSSLYKGSHNVQFVSEPSDNRLRAVCSCGWSASVYRDDCRDPNADPIEDIRTKASEHLREQVEVSGGGVTLRNLDL